MPDNVCKCLTMACEFQVVSLGFRNLKKRARADARRRLTCKTQRPGKQIQMQRQQRRQSGRGQRFRVQNSEATESSDDSDGSKQHANNTKTVAAVTVSRGEAEAKRRATIGRAAVMTITAAEHAAGASGWALWVVSTG